MSLRQRFRAWRRRRGSRVDGGRKADLREFVYLDDVSVYSLRASQVGLIVTELTETQATSLQSEVKSSLGANAGIAKGEIGSTTQAGETQSSQVLRKAIIQTTFKQMYDAATSSLALAPGDTNVSTPIVRTFEDIEALVGVGEQSWVVDPSRLRRGELVEMEVQLEAEPIFHAGAVISGVLEIIQDDPSAFGMSDLSQLGDIRMVSRMVEKVLAGLVPLRGRAVDYEAVDLDGVERLVHRALLDQLQEPVDIRPLYLVGVAEKSLFWKDVRRVLFSGSSYRVLGRLTRDGLQRSWTPVKLVDVLRNVVPDFAHIMDNVNRGVLSAMSTAVAAQQGDAQRTRMREALVIYARLLSERAGYEVTEQELSAAGLLDIPDLSGDFSVRRRRELFAPVTMFVQERTAEVDRVVAADYRVAAVTEAGLLLGGGESTTAITVEQPPKGERFLDTEIVAVYW